MINNILIIYEEELYADGLITIINDIDSNVSVTKKILYNDLEQSIDYDEFDVVILSKTANMDMDYVCPIIKSHNPNCKVVILSRNFSKEDMKKFIEHSVDAVICKKYSSAKIKQIMGLIMMGENYYPPELIPLTASKNILSKQQLKIVDLMRYGYSNKQIAYELKISESTVKAHVTMILRKLDVVNRIQAIRKVFELGLLSANSNPQ